MRFLPATRALHAIVNELDAKTWTPDTLEAIAGHLRAAGFEIREPDDDGIGS